ncbi:MAG: bacillithiol biosynthesis cysteine-adding enzyme BshC, partial [Candidatus Aminicenantales bacterium]
LAGRSLVSFHRGLQVTDGGTIAGRIALRDVPGWPRLSRDYVEKSGPAEAFFNGDFRDPAAFERQAKAVRARPIPRDVLAEILSDQNRRYGCGPRTLAGIDRIARDRAGAIVTGQQAGLFSGPLYTVYKALTAVKLAESLGARGLGAFAPVFWLASDDHDAAEVDHITLLDRDNSLQDIRCLFPSPGSKIPISDRPVPADIEDVFRRLDELTPDSEFKADVLARLRDDYSPGRPFAEALARWMTRLFGDSGLIILDPSDPRLRELGAGVFLHEIAGDSPSTRSAGETSGRLAAAGYDPAIHLHEGILNLFFVETERKTIESKEGAFVIKETGRVFGRDELADLAGRKPALFSPNVLLRPIYQDALLPTVAYIGGPGEIAYFAQMKGIYESFDLPMPIIYPRSSATILENKIGHVLEKYGLRLQDLWRDAAGSIGRIAEQQIPEGVRLGLLQAFEHLDGDLDALKSGIAAFEPTLGDAAGQTQGKIRQQLEFLDRKVRQAAKKRDEIALRQLQKSVDHLYPGGRLQERVFNIVPYLMKYGYSFLDRLDRSVEIGAFGHQVFVP